MHETIWPRSVFAPFCHRYNEANLIVEGIETFLKKGS